MPGIFNALVTFFCVAKSNVIKIFVRFLCMASSTDRPLHRVGLFRLAPLPSFLQFFFLTFDHYYQSYAAGNALLVHVRLLPVSLAGGVDGWLRLSPFNRVAVVGSRVEPRYIRGGGVGSG